MRRFSSIDRRSLVFPLGDSSALVCSDMSIYPSWTLLDVSTQANFFTLTYFVQTVQTRRLRLYRTDKCDSREDCFHGSEQVGVYLSFHNVPPCPRTKSFLHYCGRSFLTQEDYFGFRGKLANLSSGLDCIYGGEPDV